MTYNEAKTMIQKRIDDVARVHVYAGISSVNMNGPFTFDESSDGGFFTLDTTAGGVVIHERDDENFLYDTVTIASMVEDGPKTSEYIAQGHLTVWFK